MKEEIYNSITSKVLDDVSFNNSSCDSYVTCIRPNLSINIGNDAININIVYICRKLDEDNGFVVANIASRFRVIKQNLKEEF